MSGDGSIPDFSSFVWCLIALATAGGVLALLNYLASSIRNQQIVHDLKIEITQLQSNYIKRLREQKERGGPDAVPAGEHKRAA